MSPSVEPFNEAKYQALVDGLECSEILYSHLKIDNPTLRYDSEFYNKYSINVLNMVLKSPTNKLEAFSSWITQGPNPTFSPYGEIPCLTGRNIASGRVNYNDPDYIDDHEYEKLKRFQLLPGDTLITLKGKGSIGKIGFVSESKPAIFSRNIGVVRPRGIEPAMLNAYLMSKYGRDLILRGETGGTGQTTLTTSHLKLMDIPIFSRLPEQLAIVLGASESAKRKSDSAFSIAEEYLLRALRIDKYLTATSAVSIKNLSKSLSISGRLDAEYYQPKYDNLFDALKAHNTQPLGGNGGIVTIKKSIEPGSEFYCDEGIPFVRVSDVTKFDITEPEIKLPNNIVPDITSLYPQKDTILFSKDGSVGIAYKVEERLEAITSGALLHLTVKNTEDVLPDYLTLVLNSIVVQMQAERDSSGAIIQHWKPSDIEKVIIPVLDLSVQKQIAEKVRESFALRHQSDQLLANAKRAVEIAIEEGEDAALVWLKDKVE